MPGGSLRGIVMTSLGSWEHSQFDESEDETVLTATSPIRASTDGNTIYCILISGDKPRKALLEEIQELRDRQHENVQERPDLPWWSITCPHGATMYISSLNDFPKDSIHSTCGNLNCWFVFYGPKRGSDQHPPGS